MLAYQYFYNKNERCFFLSTFRIDDYRPNCEAQKHKFFALQPSDLKNIFTTKTYEMPMNSEGTFTLTKQQKTSSQLKLRVNQA